MAEQLFAALALIAVVLAGVFLSDINRHAPIDLRKSPNFLTQWRIRLLAGDRAACLGALDRARIKAIVAPPRPLIRGCGYSDGVSLRGGALNGAPVMRCPMAVAYASWERHVLQPAAQTWFKANVVAVRHFGAFACRDIAGRRGHRSQHATSNAIDVAAFELSNGRVVSVLKDWSGHGDGSRFLRQVHDGACGLFAGVLSPDYNTAHHDHFHLDLGRLDVCR